MDTYMTGTTGPVVGLQQALEQALAADQPAKLDRLGGADTSVSFRIAGERPEAVTVLLDRQPPCVVAGSEPAEVSIEIDRRQAELFVDGRLTLPALMLAGHVQYSGPVRKYLMVDSVLRSLLAEAAGNSH